MLFPSFFSSSSSAAIFVSKNGEHSDDRESRYRSCHQFLYAFCFFHTVTGASPPPRTLRFPSTGPCRNNLKRVYLSPRHDTTKNIPFYFFLQNSEVPFRCYLQSHTFYTKHRTIREYRPVHSRYDWFQILQLKVAIRERSPHIPSRDSPKIFPLLGKERGEKIYISIIQLARFEDTHAHVSDESNSDILTA